MFNHINRKILFLVGAIIIIVILVFGGFFLYQFFVSKENNIKQTANWKTYARSDVSEFEIKYPNNWGVGKNIYSLNNSLFIVFCPLDPSLKSMCRPYVLNSFESKLWADGPIKLWRYYYADSPFKGTEFGAWKSPDAKYIYKLELRDSSYRDIYNKMVSTAKFKAKNYQLDATLQKIDVSGNNSCSIKYSKALFEDASTSSPLYSLYFSGDPAHELINVKNETAATEFSVTVKIDCFPNQKDYLYLLSGGSSSLSLCAKNKFQQLPNDGYRRQFCILNNDGSIIGVVNFDTSYYKGPDKQFAGEIYRLNEMLPTFQFLGKQEPSYVNTYKINHDSFIFSVSVGKCQQTETARKISILDSKTSALVQNVVDNYNGCLNEAGIRFDDFNFDGIDDLAVEQPSCGSYGASCENIYLYNLEKNQFIFSQEFSDLSSSSFGLDLDKEKKEITTGSKSGCCIHYTWKWKVINNVPQMFYEIIDESNKTIIRELINGEWKETTKTTP
ncbi:MAG: hypothetical protein AAB529_02895 [Patescibacteria group bacterium]